MLPAAITRASSARALRQGLNGDEVLRCAGEFESLPISPAIDDRSLVDTGNGAVGGARFFGQVFAANVSGAVLFQRNARITALLRAIMDQAILAHIQISASGAAPPPIVRLAGDQVLLIRLLLI